MPSYINRWKIHQPNNAVNCLDYNETGKLFATAGTDRMIYIYDEATKKKLTVMAPAEENHPGHSNRIFSVKFADDNTIISGGWDAVVHIWDVREGRSVRHIVGPHISGDAIDFQDGQILTGSENTVNPLQLWDLGTAQLIQNLEWNGYKGDNPKVFTAKFRYFTILIKSL
jgi:COMPASS component SWD3